MDRTQLEQLLTARFGGFLAEHVPAAARHPAELAETPAPSAPAAVWASLVERGALSLLQSREAGGLGLGDTAVAALAELMGRTGFPAGRYLDTLMAVEVLRGCAPSTTRDELLADVMSGSRSVALAYRADGTAAASDPANLPAWRQWRESGEQVELGGRRAFVESADEADVLVVLGAKAPCVVVIPTAASSPLIEARSTMGDRRLFDVEIAAVRVPRTDLLDVPGALDALWTTALARARVWQAGYLVGIASGALDAATEYARNRRQFHRPIGSFQAVAFRLAAISCRIHAARMLVHDVAVRSDGGEPVLEETADVLALAAETSRAATAECVHVHGAYGMTLAASAQRFHRVAGTESVWLGTVHLLRGGTSHRRRVDRGI
ncbi:acyl-CoA dehydrogenase family protein [Rugosimonospora africana]|uniref:Acyl-CoA dehydrogenase n=1 Tax=Rugosimonospora africana TaxID=556532 RepID=A0A8J3VV04_9ACTN|nr:acyl-CoA dehydrogenase family protein [Rugosimonospora africana]GIH19419.1 acyl-CoA dehydrogenase [Rugosimonospora africana]